MTIFHVTDKDGAIEVIEADELAFTPDFAEFYNKDRSTVAVFWKPVSVIVPPETVAKVVPLRGDGTDGSWAGD
jgi:hypothetical protein